jgi:hypothetical protein
MLIRKGRAMRTLLIGAAAATMFAAVAPAFANPAQEAADGYAVYPPGSVCHFVTQRVPTQDGHVSYQRYQVCN